MAVKRHRQGLARYRARTAATAFPKKTGPRPTSQAGRRAARVSAARGRLPKPGTIAARRRYDAYLPDTEEVRFLRRASLSVTLDKRQGAKARNEYRDELTAIAERHYRAAYNAQQRGKKAAAPKAKSPWVWVKRHKRRRVARSKK